MIVFFGTSPTPLFSYGLVHFLAAIAEALIVVQICSVSGCKQKIKKNKKNEKGEPR